MSHGGQPEALTTIRRKNAKGVEIQEEGSEERTIALVPRELLHHLLAQEHTTSDRNLQR